MEPEDLPWPGELEEEEEEEEEEDEEEEEKEDAVAAEAEEPAKSDETVVVEEVEEEAGLGLDSDSNYEFQPRESTDEEEDDEAKAWLQAQPSRAFPPPPPPRHSYLPAARTSTEVVSLTCHPWQVNVRTRPDSNAILLEATSQKGSGDDQKTESWHFHSQEMDSSQTLDTTQTRINVRAKGTEMTDLPSLEEDTLTQSQGQVKKPNRDLCSPLLVMQDSFASPDLPLLTCLTQDQEFGPDSLFHQSELDFAPLRGILDKSEDNEGISRPSEVSEALFQATSEGSSDIVNSCFSISQHPLTGSTTIGSQHSFLPPEQGNNEENVSYNAVNELKTPKDSDSYHAYISWKTRKDTQQPESNLADEDQVSGSTLSDSCDENLATRRNDGFDDASSHVEFWKQETSQLAEICLTSKDHVSFLHEIAPPPHNKQSYSFLRCLLEGRRKEVPLSSDSHYSENVDLRALVENEMKQKMDSLEGYERNEDLQKELSQYFKQKETRSSLMSSEVYPRSPDIKCIESVVVANNSEQVSEAHILSRGHDISKIEASGGPLHRVQSKLDETSEHLYFQEERNLKASSVFGEKNVDATENVAFEAVIASIEPSKKESISEIQTDINKCLTDDSQEREPPNPGLSPLKNDENSFFDKLKHPNYKSTPGVFELAASKPLLHKEDDDDSSLHWYPNLKSPPNAPQTIKPLSVIPELKSSASLSEKSHNQALGLGKTQSALMQCDTYNEPFLPVGKVKSVCALDLAEKVGSSNIICPMKVSTSDSLVLQDLKQQTFEEVADSSDYNFCKDAKCSNAIEGPPAAIGNSFSANLVTCDAKSQGALPLTGDASLIAVSQETLLKADIGQDEIALSMGTQSSFIIHTILPNDSYFVEGLQGKAESDVITLDGDPECCNLDENAVVCSERVAELQRETCDRYDLTGEYVELAALENLLDDLCDSSLHWQSTSQLSSEEESNFEKPVDHCSLDINQPFSSILPSFPHEPTREPEYHSSNLRMLRVSPDTLPKTLKHLAGVTSEGSITEVTQSKLKSGVLTTPGDSDIRPHLSLSLQDLSQLAASSPQENAIGQHIDTLSQKALADSHLTEESLKVADIPKPDDQNTGIPTAPAPSYSHTEKPNILYQEGLPESHLTGEPLAPCDQKTGKATLSSTSYPNREKPDIFYQQALPDSFQSEEALKSSALPRQTDQKTGILAVPSFSHSRREKPAIFCQQAEPEGHLPEEALKISASLGLADQNTGIPPIISTPYSQKEKPNNLYQQGLPDVHLTDQPLTVLTAPGQPDQKTGIPGVTSTSHTQRDKPDIFYHQSLPGSHLPEETPKASATPRPADLKNGISTVTSISYTQRDKPGILYQQTLPGSHLPKETLKASGALSPADQKTGTPGVTSTSYTQRDKPGILYQQSLPGSHLPEETLKASSALSPADQMTGIPGVTSTSYKQRDKPGILYQQTLPGSHLPKETLKASGTLSPADQKTGTPGVTSTSYTQRDKPGILYQQPLPSSHRPEEALKASAALSPADQMTGIPGVTSTSYKQRDKPGILYQQSLPGSHLPEEILKASAALSPADQKTGTPGVTSISYTQRDKPGILYQQPLPGSHLSEETLKASAALSPADQKTGLLGVTSTSHTQRDRSGILLQQPLPSSHRPEETLKASAALSPADQKSGIPGVTSTSYKQRDKPGIFYQQFLSGSHLPEETLKALGALSPADQMTGLPGVTSTSYTQRNKSGILYQQPLPGSHLPEETLKASDALSPADQKTGLPGVTSTSHTQRDKSGILFQQPLPSSHRPEEALKASAALSPDDQKSGIPGVTSASYTQRDKPGILYHQPLPVSHLPKETLKASATPNPADQKTGIPGVTSVSYTQRDKSGILYQQPLPGSVLSEETLKTSATPRPADQKTGIPVVTSTSYTQRDKPGILYQQSLPGSHLPEEILKASAALSPVDQKTGTLPVTSTSYSYREEPGIFYQKELSESHFTDESLNVSAVPESSDQKTGIATVSSTAYPQGEKSHTFYHQALPESYLSNQAPKVSGISGSADQKFGTATVPSTSYSHEVQPGIYYQHELPDSHLPEETLKISAGTELADQKAGIPTGSSSPYSHGEKSSIFYQQEFPDLPTESLKTSVFPGPADQKSEVPTVPSVSHSYGENPIVFYQQELPDSHPTEKLSKVLVVSGPIDQKTGVSTISSPSYSHIEKPVIFYQQTLLSSHPPEEVLKGSSVSGPADQIAGAPTTVSSSYSYKEKPSVFYQQMLPDSHLTENALNISDVSGPPDQKTETPTLSSTSYSQREKPGVFYQQAFPDSHLTEELLNVSAAPRPADQKTSLSTVTSTSYSQREKPGIFYQQTLPGSQIPGETLKVSASRPTNQKTGLAAITSTSYSQRDKPGIFYQQALPGSHIPGKSLKVSAASRPADQKTGIPTLPSSSCSLGEKSIIFYQHALPDSPLTKDTSKVSAISGPVELKTETPTGPSDSNLLGDKSIISYSQTLPESHLTTEALNILASPGSVDLKTGKPTVSSTSYSSGEKPSILYQQALPDTQPTKGLKVSIFPEPVDQKIRVPTVTSSSYSNLEKTVTSYQQELPDSHLTEKAVNVSIVPGPTDQKTGIPIVPSTSYSHREKPGVSYQQEFPDLTEEALKVLGVHGSAEQNNGIQIVSSTPYSHREKSVISYQQELPDLTVDPLKVLGVPRLSDQKIGIHIVPSTSYPHEEKPIISYQQEVPALPEVALKTLGVPGSTDQKTGIQIVPSNSYLYKEKPNAFYQQELPNISEEAVGVFVLPGLGDQNIGTPTVPLNYYSHREKPIVFSQKELPVSHLSEETLKVSAVSVSAEQKTGLPTGTSSSYFHRENPSDFYQQALPDSDLTEESLKASTAPGVTDQNRSAIVLSSSYSDKEKLKISTVSLPDDRKTELPTATHSSYLQREKSKISTVIGPDDQKTPLTVFHSPYSQRVRPGIFFQQQLSDTDQSGNIQKSSTVPEPTDIKTGVPIPLSDSYLHREKANIFYSQGFPDRHLTENALIVSTIPEPADQKTVLPTALPGSFSHRERYVTKGALKVSSGFGQSDGITGLPTGSPGIYSHGEAHKLVSGHVLRLTDNLNSSYSSVSSNNMPLNSQAVDGVTLSKPESSGLGDVGAEEIRDTDNSSKTLKEIRTLLMEAENIALKRCNFPAPLVPFRDVSDISFIQSKKMVCFKEPSTTDVTSDDLLQRQLFTEESQSNRCIQKDIGTQTNLKCQRGIENWEFISSTTIRSPLQEAENKARMELDETFRQYEAAKSIIRSEPEGYSGVIGNKIIIPMMTIIKSDSSSDVSDGHGSCSWDSNLPESLESVSDVLLNFLPYASPKTSIADSREEEGVSDSEDGCGSVDSLAAHVKNLLQCESSLNHARQILRNAEEEECRVRARAWNLKFNLAHDRGYPTSELNDDDRRKVEEIKAELFGHGRTTDLSEGLQSPRGIGGTPDAVCSHIIIESHEKGCFRTLTAQQPQVDSHPCVFRSAEPSDVIRGRRSPTPWRTRHINFSKSLDQNNSHFRVWNSLQLQSHPPFQSLMPDDFKVSKGLGMPFRENMDPWLSELVEPACVPPKEVDFHSSSQIPPPEPMKQFTTSITFSSHRHSKCISDSSVFKVGVTEGSQYTGAPVGVFNSHVTEEQNSPRYLKQRTSSPLSFKKLCHLPNKEVTILAEGSRQSQKLSVDFEHSHQEEKLLEKSDFEVTHSEPSTSTNYNNFKEVQFSDNHTPISMGRPCSTLGVREKNVIITSDLPSHIFLEQRQLFEQSQAQYTDHYVRKHHSPPCPNLPSCIFLEQQELFEQSKVPHIGHEMRESHSPFPQCQDNIAPDLSSPIFLEQRQSKPPAVDAHHFLFSQSQDSVVEKNQHAPDSHICNMINVEATFNDVISQSVPDHCKLAPSASTPPSNRKALSCIRITLCPKTSSKLDSGILDKRFHSLDPASRTNEFNSHLQIKSTRSLESASILLTSKPVAQDQESLGFLGPKSPLDLQVIQSPPPDSKTITQNLKTIPSQNSQIVTSRQTQVNFSDLEEYSKPEETPVSADGSREQSKTPFSASSGKLSSDAVTQITTESPGKTTFSSEIFINADNRGGDIPEPSTQKLQKPPVTFPSSSSVQESTTSPDVDAQPVLLPYKPPGSKKMYYVPQLATIASLPDSKSDTTIESSHSGSNDAIAPDFPVQVLGTRDDDLLATVNIKHKEGIYSKRARTKAPSSVGKKSSQKDDADAPIQVPIITSDEDLSDKKQKKEIINERVVTKVAYLEEKESLQRDTTGSIDSTAVEHLVQVQDTKIKNLSDTKAIEEKEEIHFKRTVCKEAWPKEKESLQTDISEPKCHSEFENTTHSVFRSAKFYFHHPVHPSSDQDFCHESLGKSVFMRHSCKDFFQQHSDNHREPTCLPPSYQNVDKTKTDYMRIKNLSINVNLGDKEMTHTTKSQARDHLKSKRQINDAKRDHKVSSEPTTQHTASLNELWNKYQERHRQQKPPDVGDRKELSLIERLDHLAKLLQNPITHSLQASESTQDDSRGEQNIKDWRGKQKSKLQKQKWYKSLEKGHKNISDLKRSNLLSPQPTGKSNQIKIEQVKFDKYILRKQPDFNYISNTSSDSRPSEESELLTDTPTNVLSTTPSPVDSDILTQTDREVTWRERSSSISTIDTARLIQAFGHERVCLSPRQIKLHSSITNQQRRYLEKRCKHNKKALSTGHPLMTSEHTRRRHIQEANQMISSDSVSSASSFLSLNSTLCSKQNVHILSKGIQAGNLEIVNGVKKNTRDVGMTFPTPSPSEAKLEEDSDVTSWSEERIEEKMFLTNYLGNKKLKNKQNSCEGVSWFVPVENVKSGSKKENFPKNYGPGVSWFESITKTKPWREPLREQNWQGQCMDSRGSLSGLHGDDGQNQLRPFVRTLQESLQLHRPDFISRSGERIKRLKLIVQERKLQNMFQCERNALFNATPPLPRRVFLLAQKNKPIGKKEMIQRSKRIYEQLPEVQKKREEERRKSEYKSYRLRAQLYKKKVTNQLLGRKVPWD